MKVRILFFEDDPHDAVNELFRQNLSDEAEKNGFSLTVHISYGVDDFLHRFENNYDMIILDIRSEPSTLKWLDGRVVNGSLTGIALLQHCRAGKGNEKYSNSYFPIFIRSNRGDARAKELAHQLGVTRFFEKGIEDEDLIDATISRLQASSD